MFNDVVANDLGNFLKWDLLHYLVLLSDVTCDNKSNPDESSVGTGDITYDEISRAEPGSWAW